MRELSSLGSLRLVSNSESGVRHASQQSGGVVVSWRSRGADPIPAPMDPLDVDSDVGMYCQFSVEFLAQLG